MEFVCYADWRDLPESAGALFAQAEKDSIFFSRTWFENLANHALDGDKLMRLACVIEQDRVLAILPLMKTDNDNWQSLGHLYTSLFTVLLARDNQQNILDCLVRGLHRLQIYSLRLFPAAENDRNLEALQQALESSGFSCHRQVRFKNWFHRLKGQSFADYMAARPTRVRHTIARKQRKLEREHGYHIRLYTDHDLSRAMADYNAVYEASWKANEVFGPFVQGLANRFATQGWLRLAILYIEDRPAAAQFWFVAHGKASIFKLVYDEAWKRYSPGSILISYLMEQAIDSDKVSEIDFLTGNDPYKQDWMSECRDRWGLYCARPRIPKGRADRILSIVKGWTRRTRRARASAG